MDQKFAEEEKIRRYLLGMLPEDELSDIGLKLLSDEELSQTADVLEDEIIQQYVDEDLDPEEMAACRAHFLRSPAHRKKLEFEQHLRQCLDKPTSSVQITPVPPRVLPSWLTYGALTSAAVLGLFSTYLGIAQYSLKQKQVRLQAELNQARAQSDDLEQRLHSMQGPLSESLELKPGLVRSGGHTIPAVTVKPTTRLISINLALQNAAAPSFRIRLVDDHTGREILSLAGLIPHPHTSVLTFDLPAEGIKPGPYTLAVSPESAPDVEIKYPFDVQ